MSASDIVASLAEDAVRAAEFSAWFSLVIDEVHRRIRWTPLPAALMQWQAHGPPPALTKRRVGVKAELIASGWHFLARPQLERRWGEQQLPEELHWSGVIAVPPEGSGRPPRCFEDQRAAVAWAKKVQSGRQH